MERHKRWPSDTGCFQMAIDYSKAAFISTLKYMRKYNDHTLPSGGGAVVHGLGYVPYFMTFASQASTGYLVPIRTGNVYLSATDIPFYIVSATATTITITEDIAPVNPASYFIRVYEDPLP
jgi:hypothetical protein